MKPLESYKTGYDLPKVFHVKTKLYFNSTANPTLVTTDPLTQFGLILLSLNHSSYNCPMHCGYCSDDYYPNGKCLRCDSVYSCYQNYLLQGGTSCFCSRNSSMVENITTIQLNPDEIGTDLTMNNTQATSFFKDALFFKYGCNPTSVFSSSNCFNSTYSYFDPRYLTVVVAPSSNILSYTLTLNNTNTNTISSSCSSSVKANTYLLGESLGGKIKSLRGRATKKAILPIEQH